MKIRIGLIRIFLLDFPAAQRTTNSLSLFSLFNVNKMEINKDIGIVSCKIFGKSKNTYEK